MISRTDLKVCPYTGRFFATLRMTGGKGLRDDKGKYWK
jgi:hypothetical protein